MNHRSKKRGFVLYEAMMAVGLSMALVVGIAQLLVMVAQQRRLARQHTVATREVGNLMEQAISRPWSDTTSEGLASTGLAGDCSVYLPEPTVSTTVVDEDRETKRITIEIEWESAPERARESVRLVGWRYLGEEEGP